jgi:predicted nucleic acid-binding protein
LERLFEVMILTDYATNAKESLCFPVCRLLRIRGQSRIGHDAARTFGQKMRESSFVRLVPVAQADEERAWEIFSRYRDQDFSYADCTSFAVMQRMKLGTAFTFDRNLMVMKFAVVPGL